MKSHVRVSAALFCWFGLAVFGGCAKPGAAPTGESSVPEFARPRLLSGDDHLFTGDAIAYRALTRADFRAAAPPAGLEDYAEQMGAVTCAAIRSRPGAEFSVLRRGELAEVRVEGLVFEAQMDRGCSWWNAKRTTFSEAYVLEHEQIHLALFEVEARRLTRRLARETVAARYASEPDALAALFERSIERELNAASHAVLERSLSFDEETSFQHRPEVQTRWLERVQRELAQELR